MIDRWAGGWGQTVILLGNAKARVVVALRWEVDCERFEKSSR